MADILDLSDRTKLRCKNTECELKDGFFVWNSQKQYQLKLPCILCGSGVTQLDLVKNEDKKD